MAEIRAYNPSDYSLFERIKQALSPKKSYAAVQSDKKIYAGTGDADEYWNTGWNEGFNNPTGVYNGSDPNARAGFLAGQNEFYKRNGTSNPNPNSTNNIDENGNLNDEANNDYNRKKNAILSRLQMMKEEAQRLRGSAKGTYDFTTGQIKDNYGKLKELSKEKLQQALEGLTQADTGVQNTYGRLSGNALRAMESAITRNRMLHRALGSLGSSFYANAQGDTTNQGMNTINDVKTEEAGKRAAIGTQTASTKTDFAQNDVAIAAEESQLNQEALDKYNESVAQADLLEKNYNIDSTEAIAEADNSLTSALNRIKEYIQDKTLANKATAASTGTFANFSNNYDAEGNIKPTLDNNENYDAGKQFIADASKIGTGNGTGFSNTSNDNSFLTLLKNRLTKKDEDKTGYYVNGQYYTA